MYVRDLQVRELRCLARARAEFRHPDRVDGAELPQPNVNLLLGTNGGGKSTVLKAIVLAALSPDYAAGTREFPVGNLVRRGGSADCEIRMGVHVHPEDLPDPDAPVTADARLVMRVERRKGDERVVGRALAGPLNEAWSRSEGPAFFLVAYGASRKVAEPGTRSYEALNTPDALRLARVRNLLDEEAPLIPLEDWLGRVRGGGRRAALLKTLDALLPPDTRFTGRREGGRYLVEHREVEVPFSALSDGLRSYLAWVCDLLHHLYVVAGPRRAVTDVPGVVLVDEIDQRLHPRWQQRVIPTVAGVFPRLQIVASSHSPLVAGSVHHRNLHLLEPDSDARGAGAQRIRRLEEEVYGRTADRILQGSYFELESTRSDEFRSRLRRLVDDARDRGDERVAARFLRALAGLE